MRRNTPIATLIKNYTNKKSSKVVESRKEIQQRFWALDWKDQKNILAAFLAAGKADRHWAYKQVLDYWDNSFGVKVRELWELYHEQRCKWVVIRYLPLDYVRQNMSYFTDERDYYFVCLRLAENKDYVIERDKLSHTDYLSVLYHTGRTIDEKEGLDVLFQIMHSYCIKGIEDYDVRYPRDDAYANLPCPIYLQDIRLATYYLEKLNCFAPVLSFKEWSDNVKKETKESEEYKRRSAHPYIHYDSERRKIDILRKYAYIALDEKYKMPSDPSLDDILKPVEAYSYDRETISEVFPVEISSSSLPELSFDIGPFDIK